MTDTEAHPISPLRSAIGGRRHVRADHVVWRCGPDRVLLRNLDDRVDRVCTELFGAAALVWLALDEPATDDELSSRLSESAQSADWRAGLTQLRDHGLVTTETW